MTARPGLVARLALATVLLAAGCGSGAGDSTSGGASAAPSGRQTTGTPASGSAEPSPASSPSASLDAGMFENPVIDANFADPFVFRAGDTWYAYATGDFTVNLQVATSPDLVTWERRREALPRLPPWQPNSTGLSWAPEVVETEGGFALHYTGRDVQAGKQCLAVAIGDAAEGPFVDESEGPLVCQTELGGSIDSTTFRDEDGSLWLIWKNDGNCCGQRTRLFLQGLEPDGVTLRGDQPVDLGLENDEPWERNVIEAPTLVRREDRYYLFYSANDYGSDRYAVGYAIADRLEGPYTDAEENPILVSEGEAAGPGHQSIVTLPGGDQWIAYHAWDADLIGDSLGGRRALWLDELRWEDGRPVVDGPDGGPQPAPVTKG